MNVTTEIQMDLTHRDTPTIDILQGDANSRSIRLLLCTGKESWPIPEGASVLIRYARPDGSGGTYDTLPDGTPAYVISGNAVTVTLAPAVAAVYGSLFLAVTLVKGDAELTTFRIIINVAQNPTGKYEPCGRYTSVSGLLKAPENASVGQYLRVLETDEEGRVTEAEAVTLPAIPEKASDLENDCGYLTEHQDISGLVSKENGKGLSANDYDDIAKAKVDAIPDNPKYTDTVISVDKTLAMEGQAADAKATGALLTGLQSGLNRNTNQMNRTCEKLDALWKLNAGISYDFVTDDSEAYEKAVPAGCKFAAVEMIGVHTDVERVVEIGKNILDPTKFVGDTKTINGITFVKNGDEVNVYGTATDTATYTLDDNFGISLVVSPGKPYTTVNHITLSAFGLCEGIQIMCPSVSPRLYIRVLAKATVDATIKVMVEKGDSPSDYSPFHQNTYIIPEAVRSLPGYGWSAGEVCNSIQRTETGWQYVQRLGLPATNGVYTVLDMPVTTDITDLMADFPMILPTEAGGSITFANATQLPVPSTVTYIRSISEVGI